MGISHYTYVCMSVCLSVHTYLASLSLPDEELSDPVAVLASPGSSNRSSPSSLSASSRSEPPLSESPSDDEMKAWDITRFFLRDFEVLETRSFLGLNRKVTVLDKVALMGCNLIQGKIVS